MEVDRRQEPAGPTAERHGERAPAGKAPPAATFGFTPAQQIMFQSSSMNGHQVVMVTPEVARSLGIVAPSGARSGSEASIQIQQDTGDVSVSVMDTEDDGMIDPDQFLAMELASGKAEAVVDEDLTSLSWLHSRNLLRAADVRLKPGPMASAPLLVEETAGGGALGAESPTSDYRDDSPDAGELCASPPAAGAPPAARDGARAKRHPPHLPYDPKVHVHFKPPFSFSCLIFMSIEDSPNKALPVKEIYGWIMEHFPFYRAAPVGWKNSVRHNLSLNKCFKKIEKAPSVGKGSLWTVDALFRPNLIQALKRSPCVQSGRSPARPWSAAAAALGAEPTPGRGRGRGAKRGAPVPARRRDGENLPNPDLFPFLSRRLLTGPEDVGSSDDRQGGAEVEDAADGDQEGLIIVQEAPPSPKQARHLRRAREGDHDYGSTEVHGGGGGGDTARHPRLLVITRCPEEEHTYALDPLRRRSPRPLSDDEAFSDDSNLSHEPSGRLVGLSPEEVGMRFVEEGV
ncbi:forkhead box protein J1-like [Pollicipes pollicipes]|uniref:forkhead box protein J1-like n=1 Tax=Pollicipes pollicipes TaxID=41117 RepID=UPI001884B8CF|nr:forkhead box protein J1-like [Pollicipes pollicipes]